MSATVINQVLAEEAGRIGLDILSETMHQTPWIDLVQNGLWPDGMGDTIKVLTMGRAFPATAGGVLTGGTWTSITSAGTYGQAGGACLPTVSTVNSGSTAEEYSLAQSALESDRFCVTNLRSAFARERQLASIRENLAESTKFVMVERARDEYARLATHQVLVAADGVTESTTMPSGSGKTPGVIKGPLLTKYYEKLIFNGAGSSKLLLKQDGSPIFPFITTTFQSDALKRESGTRDDYRWNPTLVGELVKLYSGYGALSAPLRGFQHIVDPLPPRWEYSGAWNRVWPYVRSAGDQGYVFTENPAYETAAWEDSYIFHPDVMRMLYPSSIASAGGGTSFQPVQYRGEWKWQNEINLDSASAAYNPDGTLGQFRAIFQTATEPLKPRFGVRIRHARCIDNTTLYAACS